MLKKDKKTNQKFINFFNRILPEVQKMAEEILRIIGGIDSLREEKAPKIILVGTSTKVSKKKI